MSTKEQLHRLVDSLPESELATAVRVLGALCDTADLLAQAPEDDEPVTDEDRAAIAQGWAEYRQGKGSLVQPARP